MSPGSPPVALSIAGSDSGGGAGIAADLKTFAAHGVFGTCALTSVTAQDSAKVHAISVVEATLLDAQIDAVLGDFPIEFAKTGMLATLGHVALITERARTGRLPALVVDPVLVSSTGASLLEGDPARAYGGLLPFALIVTPNMFEAEALLGRSVRTKAEMADAARALVDRGVTVAVVKGGHLDDESAYDCVYDGTDLIELVAPKISTENTHGTGCTLSAAIVANLALGFAPIEAITRAKEYVSRAIASSAGWRLGIGFGPLDHFPDQSAAAPHGHGSEGEAGEKS